MASEWEQSPKLSQGVTRRKFVGISTAATGVMHVQGWSAKTRKITPVGQDTLDWKKIFTAAKTGGIQNYFVEMNLEMMRASVPYLHDLKV